jgi:hypothetical protein
VRGLPVSQVLLDEAAHFLDTDGNQAAEPIYSGTYSCGGGPL